MHYLPYGQLLANQSPSGYDERFKFIGKERDWESGYDYFGARYYISPFLHWMSVDPLSDKNPGISSYAYCRWNPLKYMDPYGEEEWTLDTEKGVFTKVGDRGGCLTDYYNIGKDENGTFKSRETISIDRDEKNNINAFRIKESNESTISAFHIPDAGDGELQQGFFLEPPGPDSDVENSLQRIPEGSYDLRKHYGEKYSNVPRLYKKGDDSFNKRAILIHAGNYPRDTKGCLLPGKSMGENNVWNSQSTLSSIQKYIDSKGYGNVRLNIFNVRKH